MPIEMIDPARIAHPMSTGRGPNFFSRIEKIGENPAAAMLLEPKLGATISR